jgi:hypothetical protein
LAKNAATSLVYKCEVSLVGEVSRLMCTYEAPPLYPFVVESPLFMCA